MKELNVNYHIANDKCRNGYMNVIIPSFEGLIYPDEILNFMPDMIAINQEVKYYDAKGEEQTENRKIMLIVGKEENASKVLTPQIEYLVGQEFLERSVPLLSPKNTTRVPLSHLRDTDPYVFLRKCMGTPSKMIVYESKTIPGTYIFPKTNEIAVFETPAELKEGFYTFVSNYFANESTKEKPKVYTKKD